MTEQVSSDPGEWRFDDLRALSSTAPSSGPRSAATPRGWSTAAASSGCTPAPACSMTPASTLLRAGGRLPLRLREPRTPL